MLLSCIWLGMLLLSAAAALLSGGAGSLTAAALCGAQKAVELGISLAGGLCLWSGLARLLEICGAQRALGRFAAPLLKKLFPLASADAEASAAVCGNLAANLLGLGSAATPLGISAVRRMQTLSGGADATDEMCLLIVLNTASIQLIPGTVASVRAGLGAASPMDILPAVWFASLLSASGGAAAAKLFARCSRHG